MCTSIIHFGKDYQTKFLDPSILVEFSSIIFSNTATKVLGRCSKQRRYDGCND